MSPLRAVQTAGPAPLARTPGLSAKKSMKTSTFAFGTTNLAAAAQDLQFEPLRRRGCAPSMRSRLVDLRIAFSTTPPGLRRARALNMSARAARSTGAAAGHQDVPPTYDVHLAERHKLILSPHSASEFCQHSSVRRADICIAFLSNDDLNQLTVLLVPVCALLAASALSRRVERLEGVSRRLRAMVNALSSVRLRSFQLNSFTRRETFA